MYTDNIKKKSIKKDSNKTKNIMLFLVPLCLQFLLYILICIISFVFDLSDKYYHLMFIVYISIASFVSGLIIGNKKRQNGMLNAVLYNLPATILVLLISFILNGFALNLQILLSLLFSLLFAASGGIVSVNRKKKIKIKR